MLIRMLYTFFFLSAACGVVVLPYVCRPYTYESLQKLHHG